MLAGRKGAVGCVLRACHWVQPDFAARDDLRDSPDSAARDDLPDYAAHWVQPDSAARESLSLGPTRFCSSR